MIAAHHKTLALVLLIAAWGAGIALFVSLGHPLGEVLFNAALWAVFVAASWSIDARRQRKTAAKLDSQGGMLVYVRYPQSPPDPGRSAERSPDMSPTWVIRQSGSPQTRAPLK